MLLGQLGASTCVYTSPSTSTQCTLSCTTQLWRACHPDEGKTPFHSWRDCRSYCSFFKVRNLRGYYQIGIKLCTSLNSEILTSCQQFMWHKYFSSLMMAHIWPDLMLLCFFLSGGCSCSATLQTRAQEAPDRGTRAGDPWAFSHYKCDFFPASSQASPPSPKVKTCTKYSKVQHEIWCSRVCPLYNFALNSSVSENASQDTDSEIYIRNLHLHSEIYISLLKSRLSL